MCVTADVSCKVQYLKSTEFVDDVPAAVHYYRDVLGFRVNYQQDDLGVMYRDAITILLIARTEQHKGIGSFGVYVRRRCALRGTTGKERQSPRTARKPSLGPSRLQSDRP